MTLSNRSKEKNRPILSYQGIPYAAPPVGRLRFAPPQPAHPWQGLLKADRSDIKCPQVSYSEKTFEGQEDCLYLNVYAPPVGPSGGLPVMVWIHGGAYAYGHAGVAQFGPERLLDKDVVSYLVCFNV